jgi:hypothetical protein
MTVIADVSDDAPGGVRARGSGNDEVGRQILCTRASR